MSSTPWCLLSKNDEPEGKSKDFLRGDTKARKTSFVEVLLLRKQLLNFLMDLMPEEEAAALQNAAFLRRSARKFEEQGFQAGDGVVLNPAAHVATDLRMKVSEIRSDTGLIGCFLSQDPFFDGGSARLCARDLKQGPHQDSAGRGPAEAEKLGAAGAPRPRPATDRLRQGFHP